MWGFRLGLRGLTAGVLLLATAGCTDYAVRKPTTLADTAGTTTENSSTTSSSSSSSSSSGSTAPAGPQIVSAVPGPATATDYFHLTTTFVLTASEFSANGDNTVQSSCPGGGLNSDDTPKAVEKLSDAPATDGSGNILITLEFAIPSVATNCSVTITRPDGVKAMTTVSPYWLGDPTFNYQMQGMSGAGQGIGQGAQATVELTGAPDSTPVWMGWYNSPSATPGGQSGFTEVYTDTSVSTTATGTLNYTFGGPSDPRTDMGGGYYLIIVIDHQLERIYWPG